MLKARAQVSTASACTSVISSLTGNTIEPALAKEAYFQVTDLLNLEVDLLFFDTASTYFKTEDGGRSWDWPTALRAGLDKVCNMSTVSPRHDDVELLMPRSPFHHPSRTGALAAFLCVDISAGSADVGGSLEDGRQRKCGQLPGPR